MELLDAMDGTSGRATLRCGVMTASARIRPSRTGASTAGSVSTE
jgi:hypothetical protein